MAKTNRIKKSFILLSLSLLLILSLSLINSKQTHAATNPYTYQRWMNTCGNMLKNLKRYKFRYSNSGTKSSYPQAVRKARKTNCALYVSWCLQEYGALKRGQTFYVTGSGKIRKNFGSWGNKVKIIKVYKRRSSVNLLPGDVVCWSSASHVNIYAGKTKKGKSLWYDGGKVSTAANRKGSRYKNTSMKSYGYLQNRKISYIIRIKNVNI